MQGSSRAERQAQRAAWAGACMNVLLTVVKGSVGWWTGSRALVADAVHSAADVIASLVVIVGLRIANKPPDENHPYGHGKAELISSALVGLFLLVAAADVGYGAIHALSEPPPAPHVLAAATALAAIVIKEALFQYSYRLGQRLNSRSLLASAYDHRSDVVSSTAALVGIVLSLAGAHWGIPWLLRMDAAASALVAVLIGKMGIEVMRDATRVLMDTAAAPTELDAYRAFIEQIEGVQRIDELRIRDHGRYVIVDVKIGVDAGITVAEGHDIAAEVKRRTMEAYPRVLDVFVHVNPYYRAKEEGTAHD